MALRAGAWKSDITPPLGCYIAGSFGIIRAERILDGLHVHALVLDDGATRVAIVSCDIIGVKTELVQGRILPGIHEVTGIPKENIIICATHIHSGPVLASPLPEVFGWPDPTYNEWFCQQIVSAVQAACERTVEVVVKAGRAMNDRCVFNRRLRKPDGSIVMNWVSRNYTEDLPYTSERDTELIAIRMDDLQGHPVALLVNYGNHNNAKSGPEVNPDMAGHMRKVLAGVYGQDMVTVFLMGPSGNVNWIDHRNPLWHEQLSDTWIRFGTSMAGTVMEALTTPDVVPSDSIAVVHEILQMPERPYCDYDTFEDGTFGPPAKAQNFFDGYRQDQEKFGGLPLGVLPIDIHVIRIGSEVAIATNPFEFFIEFGRSIKDQSPYRYTIVAQLTNGSSGYVPTLKAFEEGGYEVRKVMMGSHMAVDTGDRVVDCSLGLLRNLRESIMEQIDG